MNPSRLHDVVLAAAQVGLSVRAMLLLSAVLHDVRAANSNGTDRNFRYRSQAPRGAR